MKKLNIGEPITYKTFGFKSEKEILEHEANVLKEYRVKKQWSEEELRDLIKSEFGNLLRKDLDL